MKRTLTIFFGLVLLTSFGCYQRTVAPELPYDQEQVEAFNEEIENFPWDE